MMTWFDRSGSEAWARLLATLATAPEVRPPTSQRWAALPAIVRRYLDHAIAPTTPAAPAARITMHGRIRLGRWLRFEATQLLAPRFGTVWRAKVGKVIVGSDRLVDRTGAMDWALAGLVRVVRAAGPDVTRSASGRAGGESIWVPTAMYPSAEVTWSAADERHASAEFDVAGQAVTVTHQVDEEGALVASSLLRWGDPDRSGTWSLVPFGVEVSAERSFDGVRIPSAGRAGWFHGTDRWPDGVFFEFTITGYELVGPGTPGS